MGGKSKSTTVGFWYLPAYHAGLGAGPFDAFLEFRGGDKTAWAGELTASGTISINAPNLWGGEKDQGGIVGDVDVMFGDADQQPNAYLASVFGPQQSAWRGLATLVFKGGKYGAMNPYPQKASYKICKIKKGWDGDACWYPEKAAVTLLDGAISMLGEGWEYKIETFSEPNTVWNDFTVPTSGWSMGGELPFSTNGMSGGPYWTPTRSNIWLRRRVRVNAAGLTLNIGADNGCVVWVDGVNVGSSNPDNAPIPGNEANPVSFTFGATGEVEVIVKAFAEINAANEAGNVVDVAFSGVPHLAMNPAHILYYSITQSDMGREPVESINSDSFIAAANWFYANFFGLCTSYDPSAESVEEFQQRICRVAGCSLTRSLVDGQWYIDIANGEYELESLPILTDDDILEFEEQPTLLDSVVNSVSVKYFDPAKKETIVTPPVQAPALIADFGTNHLTIEYLELPNASLATRVAQRELLARITPLRGFPLKTTRKPYAWRPSTYFRLQVPKRGISDMVCIFGEKSSGQLRSGAMTVSATQDVYSVPTAAFIEVEDGVDTQPSQTPKAIAVQRAFEAPYIDAVAALSRADLAALPGEVGFLEAVAVDPATSRDFTVMVQPAGGEYAEAASGEWTPSCTVNEAAGKLDTEFTLAGAYRLGSVTVGMPALWGDEIVRVDALDLAANPPEITLGRGCADTVPAEHAAGSRLWFWGEAGAADVTEYTDGETINVKLLTNTGSQQLPLGSASAMPVTFDQRLFRPYPPGQFKINGASYPASASGPTPLSITWVHRDRVQQSDVLMDTGAAGVGPEAGTTYTVRGYENDILTHTESGITGTSANWTPGATSTARIELESMRDGVASWQYHAHSLLWSASMPDDEMAQNVLAKLAHWYKFSETAGTVFKDSHGGMDLELFSNAGANVTYSRPTIRSGGSTCVRFASTAGAYVLGNPEWFLKSVDISCVVWVKPTNATDAAPRVLMCDSGATDSSESLNQRWRWYLHASGSPTPNVEGLFWEYGVGTNYTAPAANTAVSTAGQMIAATRASASTSVSFSYNGATDGGGAYTNAPTGGDSTQCKFSVGNLPDFTAGSTTSSGDKLDADIQDLAVFRTPLTTDEQVWLYNAGAGRTYEDVWALSELTRLWTPQQLGKKVVWIKGDHVDNTEATAGYVSRIANLTGYPAGTPYSGSATNYFRNDLTTLNGRKVLTGNSASGSQGHFVFPNARYRFRSVSGATIISVSRPAAPEALVGGKVVAQVCVPGAATQLLQFGRNGSALNDLAAGGRRLSSDSFAGFYDTSAARTGWDIVGVFNDYSAGTSNIKVNGGTAASGAVFSTGVTGSGAASNDFGLGGNSYNTTSRALNHEIAELIAVEGILTAGEWEKLEGYLAHQWGLTGNLPGGHPYKSAPPTL